MSDAQNSIMQRLKVETRDLHTHAESRVLQQKIAKGAVDRAAFSAYLGQLYHVHRALEAALAEGGVREPVLGAIAIADRMRVPDLDRDLAYYEIDPEEIETGEAASSFLSQIEEAKESNPVALLGALYVLEGSTNGGRFLARTLRQSWGLDRDGLAYFDPYGDEQPQRWAAFKRDMDGASFAADQAEAIIEMAKSTFRAIAEVSDEVSQA